MYPALIVVDLQNWFLEIGHAEKIERVPALITACNELIDFFASRGLPIVQVETVHQADRSTWNTWMLDNNQPRMIEGTHEAA